MSSVFLEALGDDARRLRPEVLAYAAGPRDAGRAGVGSGVFEVAGSPLAWLARAAAVVLGRDLLVTRHERDVPFEIVNRFGRLPSGRAALAASREFRFARGTQAFTDVLLAADAPGLLVNLLGPSRRLEVLLACRVGPGGTMQLRERGARLRFGVRHRVRLPWPLVPRIRVENGFDVASQRHTIDARVSLPLVGTVMEYRGRYDTAERLTTGDEAPSRPAPIDGAG